MKARPRSAWAGPYARSRAAGRGREMGWLLPAAFVIAFAVGWLVFSGTAERLLRTDPVVADAVQVRFSLCRDGGSSCVVDGDTFDLRGERIRIADIDTPEVFSPGCAYERRLGEAATRRLVELLNAGPFTLESIDRDEDVYGRKLRIVVRDGRSLGAVLVAEKLAHVWDGRKLGWC